ncbi:hypothetical protein D9615_000905 [Tricholomella constricta]|uniref:Uncharacterized protein n=1 Tax=Tricholomella constricta TaxID=117010 RepID=A0A8H5HK68_9AGAR|nr:hypothetical protein D9615_000905 [Tricholomella constricta]
MSRLNLKKLLVMMRASMMRGHKTVRGCDASRVLYALDEANAILSYLITCPQFVFTSPTRLQRDAKACTPTTMRRAQSVRHYARPSLALGADDLGMLREGDETNEDVLRRQLLDKDRENDKLQTQIQLLQAQLAQRPPLEAVQELEKEYKNLDLLLQGTQRENERCMAELERAKTREKMLERELTKLAGENWQSSLDITPAPVHNTPVLSSPALGSGIRRHGASASISMNMNSYTSTGDEKDASARVEQVRMLILGMEQRLQVREEKLAKSIERAESQERRFEEGRTALLAET